jgi:hypothetical protein
VAAGVRHRLRLHGSVTQSICCYILCS